MPAVRLTRAPRGGSGDRREVELAFEAEVHSPQLARRFVRDQLRSWGLDENRAEIVQVLVSELVTNAVVHAGSDGRVFVAHDAGCLRVEVSDRSMAPVQMVAYEPGATGGRGLVIVDALSDQWGVETGPDGKRVWFELAATGGPAPR